MGILNIFNKKTENKDNNVKKMYLYTEEELKLYEEFIKEQFGDYEEVIHEIVPLDIHLDIIVIPPTKEKNYYKLITMGMGAYKMNVPKQLKKYGLERAEQAIFLPPNWNIKSENEEDYWPIRQLKILSRLPLYNNSWFVSGHTISSDSKNTPYADNTKFCSMLLLEVLNNNSELIQMDIGKNEKINFYQLYPIYEEELMYIQQEGVEAFPIPINTVMPLNMERESFVKRAEDDK